MRDWGPPVTCALLILGMAWGGYQIAASAWDSVVHYRTPYRFHPPLPAAEPLVPRVILVTIDGLRLDTSRQMDFLNELRRRGASGSAQVGVPSFSYPGRAVLATGAWAEVHGITSNFAAQPVDADSVFSLARAAGQRTAAAGSEFWIRGFGLHLDALLPPAKEPKFAPPAQLLNWQERRCTEGLEFVRNTEFNFLAIDLTAADTASHDYGPLSPVAREVYGIIDNCLRKLVASQDLSQTVIIVTADHGHLDRGGHGGSEPEVLEVPLVLVGGPVRRGAQLEAEHVDVAPTICALLGLPFPATNEGKVLFGALQLDPSLRDRLMGMQNNQSRIFALIRRGVLAGTEQQAMDRLRSVRSPIARRLGLGLLFLLAWLFVSVFETPAQWRGALGALLVFYLTHFLLLDRFGLGYSLSTINREEYLESFLLKNMVLAGGALLTAAFVMGLISGRAGLRLSAATALLISLSLAGQVLWVYWSYGLWMTQRVPDLNVLFKTYLHLLALIGVSIAMFVAPLAIWAGARLRRGRMPS